MANIKIPNGEFYDIGFFKNIRCRSILNQIICDLEFTKGKIIISKNELKKIVSKVK